MTGTNSAWPTPTSVNSSAVPVLCSQVTVPAQGPLSRTDRETDHLAHDRTGILSRSEHRVAALAAQGRSNREIAATLFITVSTVEQHLTKAYRKLAVGSRNELAGMLASADPRARHETSRHETTRHETSRHEYVRRDGRAGGLAAAT